MANHLAVRLDRLEVAEMSCIAGVGGDVPALLRTATSGRPLAVLDGCWLACARSCLRRHGVDPDLHVVLSDRGVRKRQGVDFDSRQAARLLGPLVSDVRALVGGSGETPGDARRAESSAEPTCERRPRSAAG
jgi:uncharacterized metal-binding protein